MMTKHRAFEIEPSDFWYGFEAVHESYEASWDSENGYVGTHPVFHGDDVKDCVEQIDDWYMENE